ncbi:unnamed protein product [Peniophora sp. CBMAI 1063]|nr:unnamed protein product [Peniophora sp. CBMAI 1063]
MANALDIPFKVIETVYRSGRGDNIGLKCEWAPYSGDITSRPRYVFVKTNGPDQSAGHPLAHEIEVHRALSGAPGVVPFLGVQAYQESPERIMTEYSPHGDLEDLVSRFGPLGESHARLVMQQLLQGLEAIHRRFYVHMDIKPANWLIRENMPSGLFGGIIDFGCSLSFRTVSGKIVPKGRGTPGFIAPEIDYGLSLVLPDRVDIYSAGCFLFFILTGQFAYEPSDDAPCRLHNYHAMNHVCSPQGVYRNVSLENRWMNRHTGLDFLLRLLHQDPLVRPTASQALMHPWFALLLEEHDAVALSYPPAPRPYMMAARTAHYPAVPSGAAIAAGSPQHAATLTDTAPTTNGTGISEVQPICDEMTGNADQTAEVASTIDETTFHNSIIDADWVDEAGLKTDSGSKKRHRKLRSHGVVHKNQVQLEVMMARMLRKRRQRRLGRKQ